MNSSSISEETNTDGRPCVCLGRTSHIILIEVPKLDTKILAEVECVQSACGDTHRRTYRPQHWPTISPHCERRKDYSRKSCVLSISCQFPTICPPSWSRRRLVGIPGERKAIGTRSQQDVLSHSSDAIRGQIVQAD